MKFILTVQLVIGLLLYCYSNLFHESVALRNICLTYLLQQVGTRPRKSTWVVWKWRQPCIQADDTLDTRPAWGLGVCHRQRGTRPAEDLTPGSCHTTQHELDYTTHYEHLMPILSKTYLRRSTMRMEGRVGSRPRSVMELLGACSSLRLPTPNSPSSVVRAHRPTLNTCRLSRPNPSVL